MEMTKKEIEELLKSLEEEEARGEEEEEEDIFVYDPMHEGDDPSEPFEPTALQMREYKRRLQGDPIHCGPRKEEGKK